MVVKNEQKSASIVQSLRNVEYRVIHILENCAIGGKSFAKLLYDTLVHREKRWIDWKLASCPSFEKYAQKHNSNLVELKEAIETGSETGTGADRGKKRKREPEFAGNHTFHYGYNNAQVAVSEGLCDNFFDVECIQN